MVSNVTSL